MKESRQRLVEHIRNDPFIDLAFVLPLIKNRDWLQVIKLQAEDFIITGDFGENSVTFKTYKSFVGTYVVNKFRGIYERSIERELRDKILDIKATRAWRALIVLLATQQLMKKLRVHLSELLPEAYEKPEDLSPIIETIIEKKAETKWRAAIMVLKQTQLEHGEDLFTKISPLLWWINLVMESDVFEGLFKYHFIASRRNKIREFINSIEDLLSLEIKEHIGNHDYLEYEIMKALLSRCVELRGQYINKLQNAIIFVKCLRRSVKDPGRWEWFLQNELLTYLTAIYLIELQRLIGMKQKTLNISLLIEPRTSTYGGSSSILASLLLLSPIFMQYAVESRGEAIITPADVLITLMRRLGSIKERSFTINVYELAEEVVRFWEELDILRRVKLYVKENVNPESLYKKSSFTATIALLVNIKASGITTFAEKAPVLRLPPRMIGFDSLYVNPEQLLTAVSRIWMGERS